MPHDLFDDALVPRRSGWALRRLLTLLSITLHAMAVAVIVVIQVFAVGPLPFPRRPLTFEEIRLVHLADIQVPSPQRRPTASSSERPAPNAAPSVEPRSITAETGLENVTRSPSTGTVGGVDHGLAGIDGIGTMESVAPPPPTPPIASTVPVRLHAGIQAPKKIADATPVYPSIAQAAHVKGVVILDAVIDAHGNVTSVQVRRSVPLLDQAAVDAVRQWRYTPALLNGQPVPVVVTITVTFSM